MTRETDWISAHAFYRDHLDLLVVDVVHPLTVDLSHAGLAHRSFFLRYWDGGPHLRLRVLPASQAYRSEVKRLIVVRFNEFFHAHPSAAEVNTHDYLNMARTLARWEGVDYEPELRPNNSVSFAEYRREVNKYGSGESVLAIERHFVESSEIAMGILRGSPTLDQRVQAAYAMLLLAWFVAEPDPVALLKWISASARDTSAHRTGRSAAGSEQEPAGIDLARRMRLLAGRWSDAGSGSLASWVRSVAVLRDVLLELTSTGGFAPPTKGWDGPHGARPTHETCGVLTSIDICAHLICNRLGVTMDIEAPLRRLAMKAMSAVLEQA